MEPLKYQTVENQPSPEERSLAKLAAEWKARANKQRGKNRVRFCEKRMIHYRDLLRKEQQ